AASEVRRVALDAVLVGYRVNEHVGFLRRPQAETPESPDDSEQVGHGERDRNAVRLQLLEQLHEDELREHDDHTEHGDVEPEDVAHREVLVEPHDADHRDRQGVDGDGGGGDERRVAVTAQEEQDDLQNQNRPYGDLDVLPVALVDG